MTTQREVANAFFAFEDSPRRASNMRVVEGADGREFLCGGRRGRDYILAYREPLRVGVIWSGIPRFGSFYYSDRRGQHNTVNRAAYDVARNDDAHTTIYQINGRLKHPEDNDTSYWRGDITDHLNKYPRPINDIERCLTDEYAE